MIRLVWKEAREKQYWALLLIAATVIPTLLRHGFSFCGDVWAFSRWAYLCVIVAAVLGASAYSTELAARAADFLCSRPISWKRVLLAKVAVAFGIIALAAILAAIAYRVTCPAAYTKFATVSRLTEGAGFAFALMAAGYLVGAACSVVLPGTFGGILTLLALVSAMGLHWLVLPLITPGGDPPALRYTASWSTSGFAMGAVLAAILIVRSGLTWSAESRAARYGLVVGIVVLCALPLDLLLPRPPTWRMFPPDYEWSSVGPDAECAIAVWPSPDTGQFATKSRMIRASDRIEAGIDLPYRLFVPLPGSYYEMNGSLSSQGPIWTASNAAAFPISQVQVWGVARMDGIAIVHMDTAGRTVETRIRLAAYEPTILPSPDGRLVMVGSNPMDRKILEFVDTESCRKLGPTIEDVREYWWQSNREIGYTDSSNRRHVVRLGER